MAVKEMGQIGQFTGSNGQMAALQAAHAGQVHWQNGMHFANGERIRCRDIVPLVFGGLVRYSEFDQKLECHATITNAGLKALEGAK